MPSLCGSAYFYPRPPRGGRPSLAFSLLCNREISIHALREEGDGCSIDLGHIVDVFLSTPSARRATTTILPSASRCLKFLSTPSARRATPEKAKTKVTDLISIHALREEGDPAPVLVSSLQFDFYPRPPRGGRPISQATSSSNVSISIHALREEGDVRTVFGCCHCCDFYPRPPRGGRRVGRLYFAAVGIFLSTPSARRATKNYLDITWQDDISIHALREEGDRSRSRWVPR